MMTDPPLHLLMPADASIEAEHSEPTLRALYGVDTAAPFVRASMVTTLDGGATGASGRSGDINGPADLRVFRVLRSLADVVLVGAGTIRAEAYGPLAMRPDLAAARMAEGRPGVPRLAIVSRSHQLPPRWLDSDEPPIMVVPAGDVARRAADEIGGSNVIGLPAGPDGVDVTTLPVELGERGLGHIVCEGGPHLLGALFAADVVDDMCCTISPHVVGGDGPRIVQTRWMDRRLRLVHLIESAGMLMGRWSVER